MFEFKIEGLDNFQRELTELSDAAKALDGEICDLSFNPNDKESVQAAIARMEAAVDAKIEKWRNNPAVRELANSSKEVFRRRILDEAAQATERD